MKKKIPPLFTCRLIYRNLLTHFFTLWNIPYNIPSSRSTQAFLRRLQISFPTAILPAMPRAALPYPSTCASGRRIDELSASAWPAWSLSAWVQGAFRADAVLPNAGWKGQLWGGLKDWSRLTGEVGARLSSSELRFVLFSRGIPQVMDEQMV